MRKNIALLLGLTLGLTAISCSLPFSKAAAAEETNKVTMYRLYNPNSGEHFYTGNETEKAGLVKEGWNDEGTGWIAPTASNTPVYRLYNPNAGDHHYTMNKNERDSLIVAGWNDEGIGWYSDDNKTVPLYREYNPNAVTGTHNYTADKGEHNDLVAAGWRDEGIGWYAVEKKPLDVGDTVILGAYEQDNNSSNGKEEIEWKILAKKGGKALVISKYSLDCQQFHTENYLVTWENCSLRKWLNGTFIGNAFSSDEQNMIQTTTVIPEHQPDLGNNTNDKVFVLDVTEAKKYLHSDESRECVPTAYAKARGAYASDSYSVSGKVTGFWWLRSRGNYSDKLAYVRLDGSICDEGCKAATSNVAVRPAMWINLGNSYNGEEEQEPIENYSTLEDASVGDIVKFGAYEQDNNFSNGKEEIAWIVLAKEGDKALVISKYGLDCQQFHTENYLVTWENCSLRKWLNGTFIGNAFSSDEQNMIQTTTVIPENPNWGSNTNDKVFLLSVTEVKEYLRSDEERRCAPTDYAKAKGAWAYDYYTMDGKATGLWWLRSRGNYSDKLAYVRNDGYVIEEGCRAACSYNAVRPAMWINIGS